MKVSPSSAFSSTQITQTAFPDHSLLILACSRCKRLDIGMLPAIDRYDGPTFRLLRRFLRQPLSTSLDVYILSAKFGLLPSEHLIPHYDQKMTKQRSSQLQSQTIEQLKIILDTGTYKRLLLCLGKDYLAVLEGYENQVPANIDIQIADGGLGKKLSKLHDWLYGHAPRINPSLPAKDKNPYLQGIEVTLTPTQIIDVARRGISERTPGLGNFQSWYVPVDTQKVAPKWLVSQLTGLPVSAFSTGEARRLLTQLQIEVRRV